MKFSAANSLSLLNWNDYAPAMNQYRRPVIDRVQGSAKEFEYPDGTLWNAFHGPRYQLVMRQKSSFVFLNGTIIIQLS
jgi:hypothetical protein